MTTNTEMLSFLNFLEIQCIQQLTNFMTFDENNTDLTVVRKKITWLNIRHFCKSFASTASHASFTHSSWFAQTSTRRKGKTAEINTYLWTSGWSVAEIKMDWKRDFFLCNFSFTAKGNFWKNIRTYQNIIIINLSLSVHQWRI